MSAADDFAARQALAAQVAQRMAEANRAAAAAEAARIQREQQTPR